MIGRVSELEDLERWLADAGHEGDSDHRKERLLLLSGDPGVGKTRLLAETAKRAHADGALVLAGRAPEETLVAFQPFLEALGHYIVQAPLDELRATMRQHGAELARLVPVLRRRLPELRPTDEGDSETERYRLFEAVVGLLGDLSDSSSVLIVIDDLHWADRPTLMLLRHLARSPRPGRLSIVGAYRSTEQSSEGFSAAIANLRHERLLKQIELAGLPERDAARLVGLRVGRAPSADFSRALYDETEGNPFFIEEMLRHLQDSGVEVASAGAYDLQRFGLPDDVREVILRRLANLGEHTVEAMSVASVIGREFDAALLEDVLGFDEESFLGALEEALRHRTRGGVADDARPVQLLARADPRDAVRGNVHHAPRPHPPSGRDRARAAGRRSKHQRARAPLHARRRAAVRRARDPVCARRGRAGRRDAGPRAGRRPLRAGARGPRAVRARRRSHGAASCCSNWARRAFAAASARGRGRRFARRRRSRRGWATVTRSRERRSAPRAAICSRRGSSTTS